MYKNTIKNAGVGVYRISDVQIWPAYINQALWVLFGMSREDFINSISLNNILGGKYTQNIDLCNSLCDSKPIHTKKGSINVIGLSAYNTQIPLKVIYSINRIDSQTSFLFVLVWRVTPEVNSYSSIIETFDIDNLVFNELDEVGVEFDRIHQSVKIKTAMFCMESCWKIDIKELVKSFRRFVHPEDYACFESAILSASDKLNYGHIHIRMRVLQNEYREVGLWYSSSLDQDGNVISIQGIVGRVSGMRREDGYRSAKSISRWFSDDKMLLHLEFNMETNVRIRSENDLEIAFFPCGDYHSTLTAIRDIFLYKCDNACIGRLINRYARMQASARVHDFYCCDVRLLSCLDKNYANRADYRWYHIVQELFFDIRANLTIGVLSVYDVHELKCEEHSELLPQGEGNSAEPLNFDSFIIRFMEYYTAAQQAEDLHGYSALALLKLSIIPETDECAGKIYSRVTKMIHALARRDEICGKYSENVFAVHFHAKDQPEDIQERIHMLDIGLSSLQNTGYTLSHDIGYCIMRDCDPSTCSLLLERASVSLFWAGLPNNNHIYQYTHENKACIINALSSKIEKNDSLETVNRSVDVYIRTFGSFDVFVNDQAIPFSNAKTKELLAILVDRRGGFVTPGQAISYLWEDEPCSKKVLSRLRKVALLLKRQLEKYEIGDIMESVNGRRRLVKRHGLHCDYYDLLSKGIREQQCYGAYMPEYSWAETTNAILEGNYNYYTEDSKDAAPTGGTAKKIV